MSKDDLLRALCCHAINREHLIDDSEQSIEGRLDRIATVDSDVAVQDLLKHIRIGDETLAFADQLFEPPLCVNFVGMRGAPLDTLGCLNPRESWMNARVISSLYICEQAIHISGRKVVSRGHPG
jgi:hypothetical protein